MGRVLFAVAIIVTLASNPGLPKGGSSAPKTYAVAVVHRDPFDTVAQLTHFGNWQSVVVRCAEPDGDLPEHFRLVIVFPEKWSLARQLAGGGAVLSEEFFKDGAALRVAQPLEARGTCAAPVYEKDGKKH